MCGKKTVKSRRSFKLLRNLPGRILIFLIALVLPVNLLSIAALQYNNNLLLERNNTQVQERLTDLLNNMNQRMDNALRIQYYFASSDADCIRLLNQTEDNYTYRSARTKFYARLKSMTQVTNGANVYFYFIPNVDFFLYSPLRSMIQTGQQLLESANTDQEGWQFAALEDKDVLVHFTKMPRTGCIYGCWIELEDLQKDVLQTLDDPNASAWLSDRYGNTISWHGTADVTETNTSRFVHIDVNVKTLSIHAAISRNAILQNLNTYRLFSYGLAILCLCLLPLLYLLLRRLTVLPLKELNKAHREVRQGNEDYRITSKPATDEYAEAYSSFNKMADSLKDYRISVYEKELEKQDMELMNLQLQIRPHFLLNTFNLIYNLSKIGKKEAVQEIILYLSDYFRYMFRNENAMERFSHELKLIQEYISMASFRYSGRVYAEYEIDPEIAYLRVPPLLIHNFVENAVKYGIRETGELHILLRAEYNQGTVTFQISNDGGVMDQEMLERNQKILSGQLTPEKKNAHLGLYNSYRRLKYFYGEEASVTLESEGNAMTVFTIRFPYQLDIEVDHEFTDRE